jgi:hypothetical protein
VRQTTQPPMQTNSESRDATREVFENTLALYTALLVRGCSFSEYRPEQTSSVPSSMLLQELPPDPADWVTLAAPNGDGPPLDTRARDPHSCGGNFLVHWNSFGRPYLQ